jgi:hypothetical protein
MTITLLLKKELMMIRKHICLDIFEVPPPLFWRGGWEVRPRVR